jgi:hypothetical protein
MHQRSLRQGAAMTKRPITLTFAALALAGLLGGGGSNDADAARVAIMRRSRSPSAGPRQRCRWFASVLTLSAVCLAAANWYAYRVQNWTLTAIHLARTVKTWSTRERTRRSRRYRRGSAGTVARCSSPGPIRTSGRAGCATW